LFFENATKPHSPPHGGFFDSRFGHLIRFMKHPLKQKWEEVGRYLGGDWSVKVGATDRA